MLKELEPSNLERDNMLKTMDELKEQVKMRTMMQHLIYSGQFLLMEVKYINSQMKIQIGNVTKTKELVEMILVNT